MTESSTQRPVLAGHCRIRAHDWRAAVRVVVHPLVEAGAAGEGYPERCIAIAEEHGPYMVLAPGIALAHARPEDGALRVGLCAALLEPPVEFGHPDNDPVDVLFGFTAPDSDRHTGLIAALARALSAGLADRMRRATTEADVRALLTEEVTQDGR